MIKKVVIFILAGILAGCLLCSGCTTIPSPPDRGADVSLRIITEEAPPYNYLDSNGTLVGQSTEVVHEIQKRLSRSEPIEVLPWAEGYALARTEANVALFSTARTEERESFFAWVGPIGSFEYVFYAKNGSSISIQSLEDVKRGYTVGVVGDDFRYQFLVAQNVTDLDISATDEECLEKLIGDEIDLWLGSSASAPAVARAAGVDPDFITPVFPVRKVELFIAFNKETPAAAVAAWQGALDAMKRDGTFDAIIAKYRTYDPGHVQTGTQVSGDGALLALATLADARLTGTARTLERLAQTEGAKSGEWEQVRPLLLGVQQADSSVLFSYTLPDGTCYNTVDGRTSQNVSSRSYFADLMAGKTVIGPVEVDQSTGRDVVVIGVPTVNGTKVTGALEASLYLDRISGELRNDLMLPDTMFFFAVDGDGRIVLHTKDERISQQITPDESTSAGRAARRILAEEQGEVVYQSEGRQYRALFRTSPVTGWRYIVAEVTGEVKSPEPTPQAGTRNYMD